MIEASIYEVLKGMFLPSSVAVIGASREPGKVGYSIVRNLIDGGYEGRIYPINPNATEILGLRCHPNIREVPEVPDVAIIAIPARLVANVILELGEKGVKVAVIITSGFSEIGELELQKSLVETARKAGVRLVGPNIFGYYYTPSRLCATFCTPYTSRGGIALTCQSGGVGMAIIGFTRSREIGVSAIVGLGNKADVSERDLLEFFIQDENTKVVAMHMEDLKDGRRFVESARKATKLKPVVAFKAGSSPDGARAALSHTGALAGEDEIYDAAFKQAGVLRAKTLEEFLDWARVLEMLPPPKGYNVLIHTSAGGLGVILADSCSNYGLKLMEVPQDLKEKLSKHIPPFGSLRNPVDITGSNAPEGNLETMRIVLKDPRVHSIIFGYWHTIITPPMAFAKCLEQALEEVKAQGIRKPVTAALSGDVEVEEAAKYLEKRGVPSYPYAPERAVAALSAIQRYYSILKTESSTRSVDEKKREEGIGVARRLFESINAQGRTVLTEYESKSILRAFGIPTTRDRLVQSEQEAMDHALTMGFPVVLKVVSPDIIYKTDVGCVRTWLTSPKEVATAYQEILKNALRHHPNARVLGISVQTMARSGHEVIIGAKRDPSFGPVVMFGLGGVFVELFKDVTFRLAPLSVDEALEMITETKGFQSLKGFRGREPADVEALVKTLEDVSKMVVDLPEIEELDINPLIVHTQGATVVDARIVTRWIPESGDI